VLKMRSIPVIILAAVGALSFAGVAGAAVSSRASILPFAVRILISVPILASDLPFDSQG
jgi:hypothetical protein